MRWIVLLAAWSVSTAMAVAAGPEMTDTGGPLGPRRVTLGIGSIINEMDGTSESFSLWRYLKEHPLELDGRPVDVRLVSSVIDAESAPAPGTSRNPHAKIPKLSGARLIT